MQIDIQLDDGAIQKFLKIDWDQVINEIVQKVADEAVLPKLRQYPGRRPQKQPFASAKQRRYFFAALESGKITVPYRRTGKLASSWELSGNRNGVGNIANKRRYDKFVMGEQNEQTKYHSGNWKTVTAVAEDAETDAVLVATLVIVDKLD